ncbi:hypothetical protein [Nocardioides abyssi]|uniref:Septum formation-related domain-containing protein n=1 Tax=Nocardioides abyssi TaxID=3058370 RepID=A0ABT8EQA1_9ACTN|nr:hypothetical protein [Nocardioides abyssi]MDN4160304.1 hypothetical protein [Nocardioides abyssi]
MPSASRVLLASLAVTLLVVAAGLGIRLGVAGPEGSDDPDSPGEPGSGQDVPAAVSPPESLAGLETRGLAALRAPFCAGIAEAAVVDALGGEPTRAEAYDNGETAALTPTVTDVSHEHGCLWSDTRTTARGWVFAPPVTPARARGLADGAAAGRGCSRVPDAPALGEPDVALVCDRGDVREASYRGLLGDAWLVCSITAPRALDRAEHLDRAGRWCAAVVTATTGSTGPD